MSHRVNHVGEIRRDRRQQMLVRDHDEISFASPARKNSSCVLPDLSVVSQSKIEPGQAGRRANAVVREWSHVREIPAEFYQWADALGENDGIVRMRGAENECTHGGLAEVDHQGQSPAWVVQVAVTCPERGHSANPDRRAPLSPARSASVHAFTRDEIPVSRQERRDVVVADRSPQLVGVHVVVDDDAGVARPPGAVRGHGEERDVVGVEATQ